MTLNLTVKLLSVIQERRGRSRDYGLPFQAQRRTGSQYVLIKDTSVHTLKQTTTIVGVVAIITLLSLIFYPTLGIILVIGLLIAGAYYYGRPKCSYCGARGQIQPTGSSVASREPAYGIVTRTDTITKNRVHPDGTPYKEVTHVNRQERVPTLRITTRTNYHCANCGNKWSKDTLKEVEDFTRAEPKDPNKTVIIEREVVKIPCKYCGMLVDPVRDAKCPSCGANLAIGKS